MSGSNNPCGLRLKRRDVVYLHGLLLAAAAVSCATPQTPATPSAKAASASSPASPVFTERAEQNLERLYQFNCAPEYLPYPKGQGPPIPARSDVEWQERREELIACGRKVARRYTKLETIRALTWNGTTHSMSEAEMKGMAQRGPAYLEEYAEEILRGERHREQSSDTVAEAGTP